MTYSIAGADTATREVGGAGTSCLTGDDVYVIYRAYLAHRPSLSHPHGGALNLVER